MLEVLIKTIDSTMLYVNHKKLSIKKLFMTSRSLRKLFIKIFIMIERQDSVIHKDRLEAPRDTTVLIVAALTDTEIQLSMRHSTMQ